MKTEYLKATEVAAEIRCSLSKARQLMKDEMTCLAIGSGAYRTRVVERVELERWKLRQLEPPLARTFALPKAKRASKPRPYIEEEYELDSRGWPKQKKKAAHG
jgi:hypothetical protein